MAIKVNLESGYSYYLPDTITYDDIATSVKTYQDVLERYGQFSANLPEGFGSADDLIAQMSDYYNQHQQKVNQMNNQNMQQLRNTGEGDGKDTSSTGGLEADTSGSRSSAVQARAAFGMFNTGINLMSALGDVPALGLAMASGKGLKEYLSFKDQMEMAGVLEDAADISDLSAEEIDSRIGMLEQAIEDSPSYAGSALRSGLAFAAMGPKGLVSQGIKEITDHKAKKEYQTAVTDMRSQLSSMINDTFSSFDKSTSSWFDNTDPYGFSTDFSDWGIDIGLDPTAGDFNSSDFNSSNFSDPTPDFNPLGTSGFEFGGEGGSSGSNGGYGGDKGSMADGNAGSIGW